MDSKFIILTISLFLVIYAFSLMSKNKESMEIDSLLDPIIEDHEIEEVKQENKIVTIGNVLNRKTSKKTIYNSQANKMIKESDSLGGFNYSHLKGLNGKNTEWGRSGLSEDNISKQNDIQSKYLYGMNRYKKVLEYDKHFVDDPEQPTENITDAEVNERYKYMNTALNQLGNAMANSDKNNINLEGAKSNDLLTFSKSKILAPSFSFGYLEAKDPISLKSNTAFNRELPPDVDRGVENFSNEVKFNNDNKIINKII